MLESYSPTYPARLTELTFLILRFDDKFLDKAIFRSNANYGALHPETTNVIYVHGSIDPWHALGLTTTVNSQMPAIYIEGNLFLLNDFIRTVSGYIRTMYVNVDRTCMGSGTTVNKPNFYFLIFKVRPIAQTCTSHEMKIYRN